MRILLLLLCLCLPALAEDDARKKKDIQAFFKRMTAFEARISSVKRPPARSPSSAYEVVDTMTARLDQDLGALIKELSEWGVKNMGPGKIAPELGKAYNDLLRCTDHELATWASERRSWAIAGSAQDISALAAREAKAEKDYKSARDAVAVQLK